MIGALKHKVELLTATRTADEAGGASISFVSAGEIWAGVTRLAATRDGAGDRTALVKRIAVSIRIGADVALGQRLVFENETYEIVSIESDGDKRQTLVCEELAP